MLWFLFPNICIVMDKDNWVLWTTLILELCILLYLYDSCKFIHDHDFKMWPCHDCWYCKKIMIKYDWWTIASSKYKKPQHCWRNCDLGPFVKTFFIVQMEIKIKWFLICNMSQLSWSQGWLKIKNGNNNERENVKKCCAWEK